MKPQLPYDRSERLAEQIYQIVSQICYTELSDPRLQGIQITRVRMTKDLRTARVYFHVVDAGKARVESTVRALNNAQGVFKRAVGEAVTLKFMPAFEFFYDETSDLNDRMDEIFAEIERKRSEA